MSSVHFSNIVKEACVETYQQAMIAQQKGANRIELCRDLSIGGISPSFDLVKKIVADLDIPIMVMVRPRGGHFVFNDREMKMMLHEIAILKKLKVAGIVIGNLHPDNRIHIEQTTTLALAAKPLAVTFHKAIDHSPDIFQSLNKLLNTNLITNILTSGGQVTAEEGKAILKSLIALSKNKINIISAGKITDKNLPKLHEYLQGSAYHGRLIVGSLEDSKLLPQ